MMNETSKTVAFLITGCLFAVAAASSWWLTQPKPVGGYEKVGEEFFPNFDDAQLAQSVEVTAFDAETDSVNRFSVAMVDGLWRIPSHHNYPAEAADRLARTATSMIGVVRESCVNRRTTAHAEYGVLDPEDPEATDETAGKRITLRDAGGEILADYIIGKPGGTVADDPNQMVRDAVIEPDYYYVRVPEEKETYKAKVKIDLSTRFSDWINTDLLKVEADEITALEIDDYELKEQRVQTPAGIQIQYGKTTNDKLRLSRTGFNPWQLEGMNPATEELVTLPIEETLTMLDQMVIAGVRPKLTVDGKRLVNSDLSINEDLAKENPQAFRINLLRLQDQLEQKGFTIGATPEDPEKIGLLASRGELRAATNKGVKYTLYFGRAVSGSEKEIEIGVSKDDASKENPEGDQAEKAAAKQKADESRGAQESDEAELPENEPKNRSRYVAIRVDFDPAMLGEAPVQPTEPKAPVKPEGYDQWKAKRDAELMKKAKETAGDAAKNEQSEGESGENQEDDAPDAPEDVDAANDEEFEAYAAEASAHEQAKIQYVTDLELYETNKIEYEEREKQGKELVAELNERFADWYYVVPADSLKKLKLQRVDLVTVKETPPPPLESNTIPAADPNRLPDAPSLDFNMKEGTKAKDSSDKSTDQAGEKDSKPGPPSRPPAKTDSEKSGSSGDGHP